MTKQADGETGTSRVEWSVAEKRCAFCGTDLRSGRIIGTGSFADGLFCSLDCYARYYTPELQAKSESRNSDTGDS